MGTHINEMGTLINTHIATHINFMPHPYPSYLLLYCVSCLFRLFNMFVFVCAGQQDGVRRAYAAGSAEEQAGESVDQQLGEEEGRAGAGAAGDLS